MSLTPTGTITFLFTDIQGSTQLWEHYPHAMPAALGHYLRRAGQHAEARRLYRQSLR